MSTRTVRGKTIKLFFQQSRHEDSLLILKRRPRHFIKSEAALKNVITSRKYKIFGFNI